MRVFVVLFIALLCLQAVFAQTTSPSKSPTAVPTKAPTATPTTKSPTAVPTKTPTNNPVPVPTRSPTIDLCPNDPNKSAPGECGCGVAETDSDGDGYKDCKDECPNNFRKFKKGRCGCQDDPVQDLNSDGKIDCPDGTAPLDRSESIRASAGYLVAAVLLSVSMILSANVFASPL